MKRLLKEIILRIIIKKKQKIPSTQIDSCPNFSHHEFHLSFLMRNSKIEAYIQKIEGLSYGIEILNLI